jgi:hypothetical protein
VYVVRVRVRAVLLAAVMCSCAPATMHTRMCTCAAGSAGAASGAEIFIHNVPVSIDFSIKSRRDAAAGGTDLQKRSEWNCPSVCTLRALLCCGVLHAHASMFPSFCSVAC